MAASSGMPGGIRSPSARRVNPVVYEALSEAGNAAALPVSSGTPARRSLQPDKVPAIAVLRRPGAFFEIPVVKILRFPAVGHGRLVIRTAQAPRCSPGSGAKASALWFSQALMPAGPPAAGATDMDGAAPGAAVSHMPGSVLRLHDVCPQNDTDQIIGVLFRDILRGSGIGTSALFAGRSAPPMASTASSKKFRGPSFREKSAGPGARSARIQLLSVVFSACSGFRVLG